MLLRGFSLAFSFSAERTRIETEKEKEKEKEKEEDSSEFIGWTVVRVPFPLKAKPQPPA